MGTSVEVPGTFICTPGARTVMTRSGARNFRGASTALGIPANAPHTLVADPRDKDVIFIAIKDLSQGIIGKAVDGRMTGPLYRKGFGPRE